MADALVSEASVARHEGSTPSLRTKFLCEVLPFKVERDIDQVYQDRDLY
jgi:hypothetical protein